MLEDFREFDRARLDIEEGGGSHEQSLLKERATLMRNTGQVLITRMFFEIQGKIVIYHIRVKWSFTTIESVY